MANTKIPSELSSTPSISDGGNATAITIDSSENVTLSNDLTVDTNTLHVDSTNNRVGVRTVSPSTPLDVVGSTGIRVNEDGSGTKVINIRSDFAGVDPAINVSTNHGLLLQTNNTERARITSGGNFNFNYGTGNTGNKYFIVNSGSTNDGGIILQRENTNKWQIANITTDDDINFYSYGTSNSVLTLDRSSGAVTQQNQPTAIYTHSSNTEAGAYRYTYSGSGTREVVMKPQTAIVNRGNIYNTSNGRFTAPVAGVYRYALHGNLYTLGIASSAYFLLAITKNGSLYVYHYEDNSTNAAGSWKYVNYSGLISMAANDYIEMTLKTNNLTDSSYQNFGFDLNNYTHYEFQLLY
jgi:hypothetical protein|tara:strand:+ start:2148 stop:3203 length:1056 start_codon:yes stop_codon:yes gene_type:complete